MQALERSDHAEIVGGWNAKTLEEGATIYKTLCVVCHGTKEQPGSLPTALRFTEGAFKNGADPYSMFATMTKGFGQMVPQPQYTTAQKYAVIHYIRETFLRPHNPSQLKDADLTLLPRGLVRAEAEKADTSLPSYKRMDLGPALFWTFEVAPENIAQKGIAIRLDDGPGGVSKGRAWMVYDHDTMRVATATTGDFVDWKGIAFDGSHGTHTSLIGEKHPLLGIERAIGQGTPRELAIEAAVAAFFAIAADGAFRGAGDAGAVGSDQRIELFRFHWKKASGSGRGRQQGMVGEKQAYG